MKELSRKEAKKLDQEDQWLLESGFKPYHIVDGQQRLTTFVILLNEIIEFVRSLPENAEKGDDEILLGYEVVQNYVPNQNLWYYNDDTPSGSVIEIIDMKAQRRALGEFILEDLYKE